MRRVRVIAALLTVVFNIHLALGKSAPQESTKKIHTLSAGRLVANGESKAPIGENRVLTYELEEVDLQ